MSLLDPKIELSEGEYVVKKFSISIPFVVFNFLFIESLLAGILYLLTRSYAWVFVKMGLGNFFNSLSTGYINSFHFVTVIVVSILCLMIFFLFYFGFYIFVSNVYLLTNKRIIVKKGWLSTEVVTSSYEKITDIFISQNLFERFLLGSGDIKLDTAGDIGYEIELQNIYEPEKLKAEIFTLKDFLQKVV